MSQTFTAVQPGESLGLVAKRLAPNATGAERTALAVRLAQRNGYPGVGATIYPYQYLWYDTTDLPTAPPPVVEQPPVVLPPIIPPYMGKAPTRSQVGRRTTGGSTVTGRINPGTYIDKVITAVLNPGMFTLTDDRLNLNLPDSTGTAVVDHCDMVGGWFENGTHNGWVIGWSWLDGGTGQALRPKGPGLIKVSDSLLSTMGTSTDPNLGIHTEAMQMLSGADGEFTRVGFSCEPRWNGAYTPITAVVNASECGAGTVFTDCTFGYLDPAGKWGPGGGYSAIYPGQAKFVRPVIYGARRPDGTVNLDAAWYQGKPPAVLIDPVYL